MNETQMKNTENVGAQSIKGEHLRQLVGVSKGEGRKNGKEEGLCIKISLN